MSLRALQDYTFVSKYARYSKEKKRRETWNESVERVRDMHIRRYPQIADDITWAFEQSKQKRALGSQRALQFGGAPIEKKNARIFNCIASYCDRTRFFQECFWLLLCGCGTGFSVQKHHVAKIPAFITNRRPTKKTYIVPDTIEGWADALGVLISSYFPGGDFPEFEGYDVVFDYSLIRPEGAPLASSCGKAPGPEPLRRALEKIRGLLEQCIEERVSLRPIDAYDIVMHASDAVLSGGVRRSATICLFSPDDEEMATAKTGNWFVENPQRGRSNNSALLVRGKTTREEFMQLIHYVKECGEPGFVWADSTEMVVNPCGEVGLFPVDAVTGQTGWEACNLCEINGAKCKTEEDFIIAAKAAAIIGTCQAGYTDFDYLGPITKRIVEREALLGISITGMMDNPDILFDPKIQRKVAKIILAENERIAEAIGINPTARATCVKPAGTTSCILGTASGIHPHHARRYFRRSQANRLEAPLQVFKGVNPRAVEPCVWSANGTDEVITFCVEVPAGAKTKNDLDALQLLEYVKLTQQNWVTAGRVKERSTADWVTHNVSNTITVRDDEWDKVADFIYDNRDYFSGVALLPMSGDKDYPQAPFSAVYTPAEIVRMYGDGSIMASGLIVDGLHAFENNLWAACDGALGRGEPISAPAVVEDRTNGCISISDAKRYQEETAKYNAKIDWVRRAHQFAERYFSGDIKKMTWCLKDVNNWKVWCDLKRDYSEVDYTTMVEEKDETKGTQEWACAGGACTLSYA
jgi:ribonucleoside-diphosphate reductase alpha chain